MTTATDETELTPELVERVLKLSPASRDRLLGLLDPPPPPTPDWAAAPDALRAELQRRIEAVENGTMKTYTIDETTAYLRQVAAERSGR
ncbi:MAG: hypothetical protein K2V38_20335 [Gemmataceae bacterium]|nr:hypothetical protein [Gemmataceae bacterium]